MSFTRRDILRGAALGTGSLVLSPVLRQLEAHAAGEKTLPKRFVFVLQNNGFHAWAAQPKGVELTRGGPDKVRDVALAPLDLPEDLDPLTPFKDRVTILQRLNGKHANPYHGGYYSALSGSREAKREPLAETIDAALATRFPSVFPIVGLGLDQEPNLDRGAAYVCSAWGPNKPIATQCRPDLAFQSLFGSVAADTGRKDFDARSKLLDFMKDDVKRVSGRLAGPERERFDYYLHAFESMSTRQAKLKELEPSLRRHAPKPNENYTTPDESKRLEAQFELAAAALISGLTNVVTICSGLCSVGGTLHGLGIDLNNHAIGHGGTDKGRTSQQLYTLIRRFHLGQVAALASKLAAVPEGDGTILDNTVILYTSDAGSGHHSDGTDWPFVLIGNLGKRLRAGRLLEYPTYGKPGNRSINALYCTLLHAAGTPRDHFNLEGGLKEVDKPGPLSELLT